MAVTTILEQIPAEKGMIKITVAFTDEGGAAEVPKTLTKTLTDSTGNIINSMNKIVVAGLASTMNFVLSGNDLELTTADKERHFLLEWTYDSDVGTDLPGKAEAVFSIKDLVGVT